MSLIIKHRFIKYTTLSVHLLSLFHFLREFAEKKQMAILLSTHHLDYAFRFSHRVIALDGKGGIGEGFLPKMQEAGLLSWAKE